MDPNQPSFSNEMKDLMGYILGMNLSQRKAVLSLCRFQCLPTASSILLMHDWSPTIINVYPAKPRLTLLQIATNIVEMANGNPIVFGILSIWLRQTVLPDPEEEDTAIGEALVKEYNATQQDDMPSVLSFANAFMVPAKLNDQDFILHPLLKSSPERLEVLEFVQKTWHEILVRFRDTVLIPRLSPKSMAQHARDANPTFPEHLLFSSLEMEIARSHGYQVEYVPGVELRFRWAFSDLKPRAYYAYGSLTHAISSYLQGLFNAFLDSLPNTHRHTRFALGQLRILVNDIMFIYDFTSFTSTMAEQKHFLAFLGYFFRGIRCYRLDYEDGIIIDDLGDMILEYLEVCNNGSTPCHITREEIYDWLDTELFYHKVAGYLGVHGNLASCHYLHGVVVALITSSLFRSKVVGDDGLLLEMISSETTPLFITKSILRLLGIFADVKTMSVKIESPSPSIFVKRPIVVIGDTIAAGDLPALPNWSLVVPIAKTRRSYDFDIHNDSLRLSRLATQMYTFRLWLCDNLNQDEDYANDWKAALWYMITVYRKVGWRLKGRLANGSFSPGGGTPQNIVFIPTLSHTWEDLFIDPLHYTIMRLGPRQLVTPVFDAPDLQVFTRLDKRGSCIYTRSSVFLELLVKFRLVERKVARVCHKNVADIEYAMSQLLCGVPSSSWYTLLSDDLPVWYCEGLMYYVDNKST